MTAALKKEPSVKHAIRISDDISLPLDAATQTIAAIARKGAGKTYAASKLAEQFLEHDVQVLVLDTVGNWYGLRIGADGKSPGFDIPVLGGLRGDVPLTPEAGHLVADLVVDTGRSFIVDISQFSLGQRKKFAAAFGEQLWKRKKAEAEPSPVHVVLEEAQLILPQFVGKDDARMVGIWEEIVRLGRNYGIGVTMITQRPQSVNKEALTQVECLLVLQVNGTPERKALKDWIVHQGADVNLLDELPSLPVGTAYLWSPQWLRTFQKIRIAKKRTFDASATPKVGERRARAELKPLDLGELQARIAEVTKKAEENDPAALHRRVRQLEAELRKAQSAPASKIEEKRIEVPVITEADHRTLKGMFDRVVAEYQGQAERLEMLGSVLEEHRKAAAPRTSPVARPPAAHAQPAGPTRAIAPRRAPPPGDHGSAANLGAGERAVLIAVAQHQGGVTKEQLSVLTGYKRSTRNTYLQRLGSAGYVDQHGERVLATEPGIAALGDFEHLPTGDALREHWLSRLPEGERRLLELLCTAYPNEVSGDSLSASTGYARSSRNTYLQRLRSRQLVTTSGGSARASDTLFDGAGR
jgi:uncharacterized protein